MKRIYDVDIIVDNKNIFIEVFAAPVANIIGGYCDISTYENSNLLQRKTVFFNCENRHGRDSAIASAFVNIDSFLTKDNAATRRIKEVLRDFYSYYNEEYPDEYIF